MNNLVPVRDRSDTPALNRDPLDDLVLVLYDDLSLRTGEIAALILAKTEGIVLKEILYRPNL